ncbi:MAG: histidinol-phosphatase [Termitinemataceae bacterium]|nr:MAG: histidinol-phosphatase [Termitinemataceae bacterium]
MRYSCLHTHCSYCDGSGSVDDFCEAAVNKGFAAIGFSSHAPLAVINTNWHMKKEVFVNYVDDVCAAAKKYNGKLKVFLGLEADFVRFYNAADEQGIYKTSPVMAAPNEWSDHPFVNFDYIIGSAHYITNDTCADSPEALFEKMLHDTFNNDIWAVIDAYYSNIELMIKNGGFDILGHIDLIKKNNNPRRNGEAADSGGLVRMSSGKYFCEQDEKYKKYLLRIANLLGDTKIVVEVNTGGMVRGYTDSPYPGKDFLVMLKKNDVAVTINADAHKCEHLGSQYETARNLLLEAGYTKLAFFEGRDQNKNAVWSKDDL